MKHKFIIETSKSDLIKCQFEDELINLKNNVKLEITNKNEALYNYKILLESKTKLQSEYS